MATESVDVDPFDLRGQEEAALTEAEQQKVQRQQEVADLKWLMGNRQGRRIMARLLDKTGVYRLSFTGDTHTTDFNEGKRFIGLSFLTDCIEHCTERFNEMLTEYRK